MAISLEEMNKAEEIVFSFRSSKYDSIKDYVNLKEFEILVNNETIDFLKLCAITGIISQECADVFIKQRSDANDALTIGKSYNVVITPQFNSISSESRINASCSRVEPVGVTLGGSGFVRRVVKKASSLFR